MIFSYSDYFLNNLLLPLAALVVMGVLALRPILSHGFGQVLADRRAAVIFLLLVLLAVVMVLTLVQGGGIHLLTEGAGDGLTVSGTISDIQKGNPFLNPRYSAYGEMSSGYRVTLTTDAGDITVTTMARGDLAVGEKVTVTYLPKSGFALAVNPG